MKRDKNSTKQKLIDAVGRVILKEGFSGIGVNSIAKEAGVDKVLIYRYFDGLDGLLKTYVTEKDYYSNQIELQINKADDTFTLAENTFLGQFKKSFTDKEFQEILLWELNTKNEITTYLANEREKAGIETLKTAGKSINFKLIDVPALSSIIIGGIYYLSLRSRTTGVFNGIDLTTEKGWKRIEKSISFFVKLLKRYWQETT